MTEILYYFCSRASLIREVNTTEGITSRRATTVTSIRAARARRATSMDLRDTITRDTRRRYLIYG